MFSPLLYDNQGWKVLHPLALFLENQLQLPMYSVMNRHKSNLSHRYGRDSHHPPGLLDKH